MKVDLGFDQERLTSLIDRVRADPQVGRTVCRASTEWRSGFRSEATIRRRDRAHTVTMDEPASMGGSDAGPNMVEMVLGAYGSCLTSGFVAHAALTTKHAKTPAHQVRKVKGRGRFARARFYVVQPGDSLSGISVKTGIPIGTLEQLNPLAQPNALQTGQRLRLRR